MLERLQSDEKGLQDHELLEILLFNAIPRKNTNEIAHKLLEAFGSIGEIMKADIGQLLCVEGIGKSTAAYLKTVSVCMERMKCEKDSRPVAFSYQCFSEQIKRRFADADKEILELYKIDAKDQISFVMPVTSHETERACVAAEVISGFLVNTRPYAILVVHNHLCGTCQPSEADDIFTKQIQLLCDMHNVKFYDHIIVSREKTYSYFASGRLAQFKETYNMKSLFGKVES